MTRMGALPVVESKWKQKERQEGNIGRINVTVETHKTAVSVCRQKEEEEGEEGGGGVRVELEKKMGAPAAKSS
jgi:hypothetical protein